MDFSFPLDLLDIKSQLRDAKVVKKVANVLCPPERLLGDDANDVVWPFPAPSPISVGSLDDEADLAT